MSAEGSLFPPSNLLVDPVTVHYPVMQIRAHFLLEATECNQCDHD